MYQSCDSCEQYVVCRKGKLVRRSCPRGRVWDDDIKRCARTSATCQEQVGSGCGCVTSCDSMEDGEYQSCDSCQVYVICTNGQRNEGNCPQYTLWDNDRKKCLYFSSTCGPQCQESTKAPTDVPSTPTSTAPSKGGSTVCNCISDCKGLADGSYPSCSGCQFFSICFQGFIYDDQSCPRGEVWDDSRKACVSGNDCNMNCGTVKSTTTKTTGRTKPSKVTTTTTVATTPGMSSEEVVTEPSKSSEDSEESAGSRSDDSSESSNGSDSDASESNSSNDSDGDGSDDDSYSDDSSKSDSSDESSSSSRSDGSDRSKNSGKDCSDESNGSDGCDDSYERNDGDTSNGSNSSDESNGSDGSDSKETDTPPDWKPRPRRPWFGWRKPNRIPGQWYGSSSALK